MTAARRPVLLLIIATVVAAALLLRSWDLASRALWLDESWSRWMTEQSWPGLFGHARRFDTHPPLYYSLLKLWQCLAPATPLGLRSLSILGGLAMLPLAWLCARKIEAKGWAAPFVLAAVAVSPPLIIAARQARPYALFALAFALALWAALSLLRSEKGRLALWAIYLIGLELVLWLHGLGALFGASLGGGLFIGLTLQARLRQEIVPFLTVHALAGLAWLPCLLTILEQRQAWTQTWLRFAWGDVVPGLSSGLAAHGIGGAVVLLLALIGAGRLLRRPPDRPLAILLLLAALLPAAMTILLSVLSSPVFLPRTLVPSVLPMLLLAGAGLARIGSSPLRAMTAVLVVGLLAATAIAQVRRSAEERWHQLAAWLDRRVEPGEEVWLLPNELAMPLGYARGGPPTYVVRGVPADFPAPEHPGPRYTGTVAVPGMDEASALRFVVEARQRNVEGVWVVSRFPHWFDPQGHLRGALGEPVTATRTFAPLLIHHYRLERAPIRPPG